MNPQRSSLFSAEIVRPAILASLVKLDAPVAATQTTASGTGRPETVSNTTPSTTAERAPPVAATCCAPVRSTVVARTTTPLRS